MPRTFEHPYPAVFDALVAILPAVKFSLMTADRGAGRIEARTRVTLRSWGENVVVYVGAVDATRSTVVMDSTLRFGMLPWGAHKRNFTTVLAALDRYLAYYYPRP